MFHFKTKENNENSIRIDNKKFDEIKKNALLIDVRDEQEYEMLKKIDNTINVPYLKLIKNPNMYIKNKDEIVITICNAGNRSTAAAISLKQQGYKAYVLENGIYGYFHRK